MILTLYGTAAVALVAGSAVGFPVSEDIEWQPTPDQVPLPAAVQLNVDRGQVTLRFSPEAGDSLRVTGQLRGFGLPTYWLVNYGIAQGGPEPLYRYTFRANGFFTELDARITVTLDPGRLHRLEVNVREGGIRVMGEAPSDGLDLRLSAPGGVRAPGTAAP